MSPDHLLQVAWLIVLAMVATVVWFVRLEGRVNLIERVTSDWIKERREVLNNVISHMERIEVKVDRINLHCAACENFASAHAGREDLR